MMKIQLSHCGFSSIDVHLNYFNVLILRLMIPWAFIYKILCGYLLLLLIFLHYIIRNRIIGSHSDSMIQRFKEVPVLPSNLISLPSHQQCMRVCLFYILSSIYLLYFIHFSFFSFWVAYLKYICLFAHLALLYPSTSFLFHSLL